MKQGFDVAKMHKPELINLCSCSELLFLLRYLMSWFCTLDCFSIWIPSCKLDCCFFFFLLYKNSIIFYCACGFTQRIMEYFWINFFFVPLIYTHAHTCVHADKQYEDTKICMQFMRCASFQPQSCFTKFYII